MQTNQVHVCLEQADAPTQDAEFAEGARYVCACGANYVYREGFNRAGYRSLEWWEAPAVPKQRKTLRDLLIHPRKA